MTSRSFCFTLLLIVASLIHSGPALANSFAVQTAVFNEPKGERAGIEGSAWLQTNQYLAVRFSALLFDGQNQDKHSDVFGGASAAAFVHAGQDVVNPYLGLGVEISSTVYCIVLHDSEEEDDSYQYTDDECEDGRQAVFALYPEFGIQLNFGRVKVTPFVRRYFDTNNHHPVTNAYGVSFSFNFAM